MKNLSIFVAMLLIISSFAMIGISKEAGNTLYNAERENIQITYLGKTPASTNVGDDYLVSISCPDTDQWPSITRDQNGKIVITWTDTVGIFESYVGFGYSESGTIWDALLVTLEGTPIYSDVAYVHGNDFDGGGEYTGLWGAYADISEGQVGFYLIPDIETFDTYEFYFWQTTYEDATYCAISDDTWYNEFNFDLTGPTNMYIYHETESGYDIPDCPTLWYVDGALEGGGGGYFDAQSKLITAPAYDPDMENLHDSNSAQTDDDFMLLTWQYGNDKIVFKKIIPEEEPDIEYTPYQEYVATGTNPNIGASGDNAVITYMNSGMVKCVYSGDRGETWLESTIGTGKYPSVYMNGDTAYCAYVNNGNLYYITSENGGATWGTPTKINDVDGSVVEEENCVEIHPAGIVWTDERDGNYDIYYSPVGNAPSQPTRPNGPTSGKTKTPQTYSTSSIDPNGDDISYGWDWDGDDIVDEWTNFYPSGQEISTTHTWTTEFTGQIKVKAKDTNDEESPWSEPLPVTMPKDTGTQNAVLIKVLQLLIKIFPGLETILGPILNNLLN